MTGPTIHELRRWLQLCLLLSPCTSFLPGGDTMSAPIILEPCAVLEEQGRLARQYRPFFRKVRLDVATRFSPAARRVAAQSFIAGISRSIPDANTREAVVACAIAEFARMEN